MFPHHGLCQKKKKECFLSNKREKTYKKKRDYDIAPSGWLKIKKQDTRKAKIKT